MKQLTRLATIRAYQTIGHVQQVAGSSCDFRKESSTMRTSHASTIRQILFCYTAAIWLTVLATPAITAETNWKDWTKLGRGDFPVRIRAIHFPSRNSTMDADRAIAWGRWTVSFGTDLPLLQYESDVWPDDEVFARQTIEIPLQCNHPAVGESECTMYLYHFWIRDAAPLNQCRIEPANRTYKFNIDCPTRLLLDE
ncbi:hypothetical protein [Bradyrhizobium oligotrophicum]|uniref:hypothetical protein n=1 Tax=Bradyrhizobium oligotrophicum TaxID=44255 RepID=UPI001181AFED|nr:hypothetical protein [Bradyrhizobium oligotrophicum]